MKYAFAVAGLCLAAARASAEPLSLTAALREALTSHPLLDVARSRVEAAEGQVRQSAARPNPLFVYQSENLRAWGSPAYRYWEDSDHFFYLQQTFETAAKRTRRQDLARLQQDRIDLERQMTMWQIAGHVRGAYWEAAATARIRDLYRQVTANYQETVTYHETRFREGAIAESDLIRVQLEASRLALIANQAKLEADQAVIRLQREMGRREFGAVECSDALEPTATPVTTLATALAQRPEMRLARKIGEVAGGQTLLQQALAKPNVDGLFGYKRASGFDTLIVGVQVPLPVFNRNVGNIETSLAEQRAATGAIRSTEALIAAEYAAVVSEIALRESQLRQSAEPLLARARENARVAEAAYRLGGTDILRLLDAQRQQLDAERLYLDAWAGLRLAQAHLDSVMGVMP
ncbi:MAG: TolC family protein [Bryobacteraceae bacterium]|nr:TolC family protein [Bryobacteraceae bacterium]